MVAWLRRLVERYTFGSKAYGHEEVVSRVDDYEETISRLGDREDSVSWLMDYEHSVSTLGDGLPWDSELHDPYWRGYCWRRSP